ncbi:MAG: hypothetical protein WCD44_03075 [Candidatus Babeliales bacterium]
MIKSPITAVLLAFLCAHIYGRDVLLEFKGAYFVPTNSTFRNCYKGTVIYGPELTIQLKEQKNWYAFASLDFLKQKGRFLSLCDSTTLRMMFLAAGIKYIFPFKHADLYLGLGFQADRLNKKSRNKFVTTQNTIWGYGGIAKIGSYIHLPHNFFIDLFFDYGFVWTPKTNFYGNRATRQRTNVGAAIFGAAIGYRF